jgi:hypothetical protein
MLAFLDRLSRVKEDNKRPFALEQHIVILGLNEVGFEVGEVYRHRGRDVLCITLDPQLHHVLTQCFEPGLARRDLEAAQEAARKATLGGEYRHFRNIFHQGMLMKRGQVNKALKKRFFRLDQGVLRYYRSEALANDTSISPIGALSCLGMSITADAHRNGDVSASCTVSQDSAMFSFTIQETEGSRRQLECACWSEAERDGWVRAIAASAESEAHRQLNRDNSLNKKLSVETRARDLLARSSSYASANQSSRSISRFITDAVEQDVVAGAGAGAGAGDMETELQEEETEFEPEGQAGSNIYSQFAVRVPRDVDV